MPNATGQAQRVTEMVTQPLYFPSQIPGMDDMGNPMPTEGALGAGFDVLTARPGDPGYSPLCEVFVFDPVDPLAPETSVGAIDMSTAVPTGELVWCIQVVR